jgi:trafficking kinesin-binding protein 1
MKKRPIPNIQSVSQYSFEVGSDGFLSPGSSMFDNFMPCGISTPEIPSGSVFSNGSEDMTNPNSAGWKKIPDKLRIIKPLEGSITLNHWQNLAKPSLNGVFEERSAGIVMRGSKTTNFIAKILNEETKAIETALEETRKLSDLENDFIENISLTTQGENSNSQFIHPEVTNVNVSQSKMATSFEPQYFNRKSSSMNDLQRERDFENSTLSTTNLGLTYVLNERNIQGGSTLSLMSSRMDSMSDIGSISSLTPSIINSPEITEKKFKSTGTPENSPNCSRSPSPMLEACQNNDQNPERFKKIVIFFLIKQSQVCFFKFQ